MTTQQIKYDNDVYGWAYEQAQLIKSKNFEALDIGNIIEELESVGKSEKRMLQSYLENLMMHKLKVIYQPLKHTRSWDLSIIQSKRKADRVLAENPSLKHKLPQIIEDAYFSARLMASNEIGLDESVFCDECVWTFEDLMK